MPLSLASVVRGSSTPSSLLSSPLLLPVPLCVPLDVPVPVPPQSYPSLLVTAGLNDPRVAYWEPAKWVAKLRATKTDPRPVLLKTDLSSGHFSASDRYKFLKETAFEYAFILDHIRATKKI